MTTPHPKPFPATTPHARVLVLFVIISNSDNEITALPVRPAPPSSDRTTALYGYPLDSSDDLLDEDLSETAESLHTQTASTSVGNPPPTRPLPTSLAFARRPGKEIPMPLDYRAAIDRCPPSTLSPSPLPLPPPAAVPPPPKHTESVRDDIGTLGASLASAMQETITLHARVGLLEHHNVTRDGVRTQMTEHDIETLRARVEAAEQRAETLQVSLGAARMDVRDLIESREADMPEMAELHSRAQDIEASIWDLKRYIGS
ncbi:hypothetical protein Tco_1423111 [Tanacetum coccineum]